MGARVTRMESGNEQGKESDYSRKSQRKFVKKQRGIPDGGAHEVNGPSSEEVTRARKRKTLQELHNNPPLGFRKFESEMNWQTMDEEIALQFWENVYKPTYTFYRCTRIAK